jgi:hypothetical protein
MSVKTFKLGLIFILFAVIVESCYYDKKENLYSSSICNNTGMTFTKDISDLVINSCGSCHIGKYPAAGISLSNYTEIKNCVTNGKFINSVKQDGTALAMPEGGKWSDCDVSKIVAWKNAGCPL